MIAELCRGAEEAGKLTGDAGGILHGRFGKDCLIALATTGKGIPYVWTADAYYADSAFFVFKA